MRIGIWAVAIGVALTAGCADQFRPAAPDHAAAIPTPRGGQERLSVAALPADLAWLSDGLKLYWEIGGSVKVSERVAARPALERMSVLPAAPLSSPASPQTAELGPETAPEPADVRFVSLPLLGETAREFAAVPSDLEAATAPAVLPLALQAARAGGRTLALPVAARWMALAYDPARLEDSASPVPPNLEAWVQQLRALRRRRPEHPPLIAAWDESRIAGSFALLLAAQGGQLLDDDGRPAFSSPEGVATVELMARMLAEGLVQPTALSTDAHRLAAALSGPYAYWLCPSEALADPDRPRPDRLAPLHVTGLPVAAARFHYPDAATVALVQVRGVAVTDRSPRAAAAWRLARFLADPVVLRSAPAATTVLANPPAAYSSFVRQARALMTHETLVPWPEHPGMAEVLGKFLHGALRRTLTPHEALERAALQISQPGALPSAASETPGAGGTQHGGGSPARDPGFDGPGTLGPGSTGAQPGEPFSDSSGATSDSAGAGAVRAGSAPSSAARPSEGPGSPGTASGGTDPPGYSGGPASAPIPARP